MNPMLGLRGVRLSIVFPGIVEMQTAAIVGAAAQVKGEGIDVQPEIMIPLIGHVNELKAVKGDLERVAKETAASEGQDVPYKFGTPRRDSARVRVGALEQLKPNGPNARFRAREGRRARSPMKPSSSSFGSNVGRR